MIKREELLKTEEYWFETIQNDIYRIVSEYIEKEGINQTQLSNKLGVSKGYISQIMNGNFNYTLKKLIELSIAVDRVPSFDFKNINEFIKEDYQTRFQIKYKPYYNIKPQASTYPVFSGTTNDCGYIKQQDEFFELKVA